MALTAAADIPATPSSRSNGDRAKKHWWAGAVAVPILVALIGVLPSVLKSSPAGTTHITNSRIGGDLYLTTNVEIADPAARGQFEQAVTFAREGLFAEAKALLEAIAPTVNAAGVYNNLAVVSVGLGDDVAAQRHAQQALQLDPPNEGARENLALITRAIQNQRSNNTILAASALTPGRPVASRLINTDDTDYFSFTTPAGQRDIVRVQIDNRTATFAPEIRLFDSSRAQFARAYQVTPGANTMLEFAALPGVTYYAQVDHIYGDAADYELSVTPLRAFDRFEPNDDILTPTQVRTGQPIEAGLMDATDVDMFRVAVKPGPIRVIVSNRSTTAAPHVVLYDQDKREVARQYNNTPGGNVAARGQAYTAGTWYVAVASQTAGGQYTLTIEQ